METIQHLTDYYSNYDEDGRLVSQNGSVEFLTTMRYIEKYLKSGDRILEIGAATGRYSHTLARKGYAVDAIELVDHNIEIFKQNTQEGESVTVTQGNAMDLYMLSDNIYDITLLFGPMYHLYCKEDKQKALSEAIRVTKQGGIIFVAYCISDGAIIAYGFQQGHIHDLLEKKMLDIIGFKAVSRPEDLFELHRKEDIDDLMVDFPVKRLHYIATDGYTNNMREAINNLDSAAFEIYLQYHFFICEREDMTGLTQHALDIFRKD